MARGFEKDSHLKRSEKEFTITSFPKGEKKRKLRKWVGEELLLLSQLASIRTGSKKKAGPRGRKKPASN